MPTKHQNSQQISKSRILAMFFIGGGLLLVGIAALLLLPGKASTTSDPEVGINQPAIVDFPAPSIQLHDLEGKPVSLEDYRGQVVLVNNWATWCPPCRQEMPILEAYFREHRHQDFTIVAIDAGDPVDTVYDFVNSYDMTFPV
jgi:thiol-disulfide isomerase/thioredoxin